MDYMSDLEKFGIKAGHIEELYADNSQGKTSKSSKHCKEKSRKRKRTSCLIRRYNVRFATKNLCHVQ